MPDLTQHGVDITRKAFAPAELQFTPGERSAVAWLSLECGPDHEGDIVVASGVDFTSVFLGETPAQGNPCVLAVHDSGKWPIGKCSWIRLKKNAGFNGIYGKILFDEDPDADLVWKKVKSGTLKGVSIGFKAPVDAKPGDWSAPTAEEIRRNPTWKNARRIIRRCVLLEFSVCSLPMNQWALIEAVNKGINPPVYESPSPEVSQMSDAALEAAESGEDEVITPAEVETKGVHFPDIECSIALSAMETLASRFMWFVVGRLIEDREVDTPLAERLALIAEAFDEYKTAGLRAVQAILEGADAQAAKAITDGFKAELLTATPKSILAGFKDLPEPIAKAASKALRVETKDMDEETEAFQLGQHVKCMKHGGCGVIKSLHSDGDHVEDESDAEPDTHTATAANPVAYVDMHDGKCMATGRTKACHTKDLVPVDEPQEQGTNKAAKPKPNPRDEDEEIPDDSESDENDEDTGLPDLRRGDHVHIKGGGFGKVVSIHKSDFVPDVDEDVVGSEDHPAARVRRYKKSGDGYAKTSVYSGHKFGELTKADKEPKIVKGSTPPAKTSTTPTPTPVPKAASPPRELPPLVPMTPEEEKAAKDRETAQKITDALRRRAGYIN